MTSFKDKVIAAIGTEPLENRTVEALAEDITAAVEAVSQFEYALDHKFSDISTEGEDGKFLDEESTVGEFIEMTYNPESTRVLRRAVGPWEVAEIDRETGEVTEWKPREAWVR